MDLNEGVVDGDNVNTTVGDAVKLLESNCPTGRGLAGKCNLRIAEDLREGLAS